MLKGSPFGAIEALAGPDSGRAQGMLEEAASWAEPLLRARGWRVGALREKQLTGNVWGLNVDRGRLIYLRLRQGAGGGGGDWVEPERLLDTLLHELAHIEHMNHSAAFYDLWELLRKELSQNLSKGLRGSGAGFDARGYKVSSDARNPTSILEAKQRALAAAEKRLRYASLFGDASSAGPQTVGGKRAPGLDAAEAARRAALQRCSEWCGNDSASPPQIVDDLDQYAIHVPDEEEPAQKKIRHEDEKDDGQVMQQQEPLAPVSQVWSCELCSFHNVWEAVVCDMCDQVRPGYWRCTSCSAVNKSLFAPCATCETPRHHDANPYD